ncbi:hypothetical protein ACIO87_29320 [Streptomyces sp. NPDC087218]|uniref:hypothetical protein n=1 Tax=Streptomyces sp. NPDC087218 TaxID=3365769 RepID=UPI00382D258D
MIVEHAFGESEDLEQEVVTALNVVPGIVDFDGGEGKREIEIPGTNAHVVLDMNVRGDEWALERGTSWGAPPDRSSAAVSGVSASPEWASCPGNRHLL